jgi:hypothetical protein
LKKLCLKYGASFFQLYSTHIHCDWRNHPLDEKFYGASVTEKSDRPVSEILAEMSSIEIDRGKFPGWQVLKVDHPEAEDGGELIYFWQIVHQSGTENRETTDSELKLPLDLQVSKVKVLIGGSVAVEKNLP